MTNKYSGNGSSLEDCHTNIFSLADLNGLKWKKYIYQLNEKDFISEKNCHHPILSKDPILSSYCKCLEASLLCVWRVLPGKKLKLEERSKELWVFWHGDTPDLTELLDPILGNGIENGSWELGITFDIRTLLFKAFHNIIERFLLMKGFVRLGKWFVEPHMLTEESLNNSFLHIDDPKILLAFSFSFFLHGESAICASLHVQEFPRVFRLEPLKLQKFSSDYATNSNLLYNCSENIHSPSPSTLKNESMIRQDNIYNVILCPYGLSGVLTGKFYKSTDNAGMLELLNEWNIFYPNIHHMPFYNDQQSVNNDNHLSPFKDENSKTFLSEDIFENLPNSVKKEPIFQNGSPSNGGNSLSVPYDDNKFLIAEILINGQYLTYYPVGFILLVEDDFFEVSNLEEIGKTISTPSNILNPETSKTYSTSKENVASPNLDSMPNQTNNIKGTNLKDIHITMEFQNEILAKDPKIYETLSGQNSYFNKCLDCEALILNGMYDNGLNNHSITDPNLGFCAESYPRFCKCSSRLPTFDKNLDDSIDKPRCIRNYVDSIDTHVVMNHKFDKKFEFHSLWQRLKYPKNNLTKRHKLISPANNTLLLRPRNSPSTEKELERIPTMIKNQDHYYDRKLNNFDGIPQRTYLSADDYKNLKHCNDKPSIKDHSSNSLPLSSYRDPDSIIFKHLYQQEKRYINRITLRSLRRLKSYRKYREDLHYHHKDKNAQTFDDQQSSTTNFAVSNDPHGYTASRNNTIPNNRTFTMSEMEHNQYNSNSSIPSSSYQTYSSYETVSSKINTYDETNPNNQTMPKLPYYPYSSIARPPTNSLSDNGTKNSESYTNPYNTPHSIDQLSFTSTKNVSISQKPTTFDPYEFNEDFGQNNSSKVNPKQKNSVSSSAISPTMMMTSKVSYQTSNTITMPINPIYAKQPSSVSQSNQPYIDSQQYISLSTITTSNKNNTCESNKIYEESYYATDPNEVTIKSSANNINKIFSLPLNPSNNSTSLSGTNSLKTNGTLTSSDLSRIFPTPPSLESNNLYSPCGGPGSNNIGVAIVSTTPHLNLPSMPSITYNTSNPSSSISTHVSDSCCNEYNRGWATLDNKKDIKSKTNSLIGALLEEPIKPDKFTSSYLMNDTFRQIVPGSGKPFAPYDNSVAIISPQSCLPSASQTKFVSISPTNIPPVPPCMYYDYISQPPYSTTSLTHPPATTPSNAKPNFQQMSILFNMSTSQIKNETNQHEAVIQEDNLMANKLPTTSIDDSERYARLWLIRKRYESVIPLGNRLNHLKESVSQIFSKIMFEDETPLENEELFELTTNKNITLGDDVNSEHLRKAKWTISGTPVKRNIIECASPAYAMQPKLPILPNKKTEFNNLLLTTTTTNTPTNTISSIELTLYITSFDTIFNYYADVNFSTTISCVCALEEPQKVTSTARDVDKNIFSHYPTDVTYLRSRLYLKLLHSLQTFLKSYQLDNVAKGKIHSQEYLTQHQQLQPQQEHNPVKVMANKIEKIINKLNQILKKCQTFNQVIRTPDHMLTYMDYGGLGLINLSSASLTCYCGYNNGSFNRFASFDSGLFHEDEFDTFSNDGGAIHHQSTTKTQHPYLRYSPDEFYRLFVKFFGFVKSIAHGTTWQMDETDATNLMVQHANLDLRSTTPTNTTINKSNFLKDLNNWNRDLIKVTKYLSGICDPFSTTTLTKYNSTTTSKSRSGNNGVRNIRLYLDTCKMLDSILNACAMSSQSYDPVNECSTATLHYLEYSNIISPYTFFSAHTWPFSGGNLPSNNECTNSAKYVRTILRDCIERRCQLSPNFNGPHGVLHKRRIFDCPSNISGPLTWQQFHKLAQRGFDERCEPQPSPLLVVGFEHERALTSPFSINYWDYCNLESYSLSKDIAYTVLLPPNDSLIDLTQRFFEYFTSVFELCKLGHLLPLPICEGYRDLPVASNQQSTLSSHNFDLPVAVQTQISKPIVSRNDTSSVNNYNSHNGSNNIDSHIFLLTNNPNPLLQLHQQQQQPLSNNSYKNAISLPSPQQRDYNNNKPLQLPEWIKQLNLPFLQNYAASYFVALHQLASIISSKQPLKRERGETNAKTNQINSNLSLHSLKKPPNDSLIDQLLSNSSYGSNKNQLLNGFHGDNNYQNSVIQGAGGGSMQPSSHHLQGNFNSSQQYSYLNSTSSNNQQAPPHVNYNMYHTSNLQHLSDPYINSSNLPQGGPNSHQFKPTSVPNNVVNSSSMSSSQQLKRLLDNPGISLLFYVVNPLTILYSSDQMYKLQEELVDIKLDYDHDSFQTSKPDVMSSSTDNNNNTRRKCERRPLDIVTSFEIIIHKIFMETLETLPQHLRHRLAIKILPIQMLTMVSPNENKSVLINMALSLYSGIRYSRPSIENTIRTYTGFGPNISKNSVVAYYNNKFKRKKYANEAKESQQVIRRGRKGSAATQSTEDTTRSNTLPQEEYKEKVLVKFYAPPYILAPRDAVLNPNMKNLSRNTSSFTMKSNYQYARKVNTSSHNLPDVHERILYCGYCLDSNQHWLLATFTDDDGSLLDTCIININIPNRINKKPFCFQRRILNKLFFYALKNFISKSNFNWRLIVSRFGRIGYGEFKIWSEIFSHQNLAGINDSLKKDCQNCQQPFNFVRQNNLTTHNMASPGQASVIPPRISTACLISLEMNQNFCIFPDSVAPELDRMGQSKYCSLSTPRDVSVTHILVIPVQPFSQSQCNNKGIRDNSIDPSRNLNDNNYASIRQDKFSINPNFDAHGNFNPQYAFHNNPDNGSNNTFNASFPTGIMDNNQANNMNVMNSNYNQQTMLQLNNTTNNNINNNTNTTNNNNTTEDNLEEDEMLLDDDLFLLKAFNDLPIDQFLMMDVDDVINMSNDDINSSLLSAPTNNNNNTINNSNNNYNNTSGNDDFTQSLLNNINNITNTSIMNQGNSRLLTPNQFMQQSNGQNAQLANNNINNNSFQPQNQNMWNNTDMTDAFLNGNLNETNFMGAMNYQQIQNDQYFINNNIINNNNNIDNSTLPLQSMYTTNKRNNEIVGLDLQVNQDLLASQPLTSVVLPPTNVPTQAILQKINDNQFPLSLGYYVSTSPIFNYIPEWFAPSNIRNSFSITGISFLNFSLYINSNKSTTLQRKQDSGSSGTHIHPLNSDQDTDVLRYVLEGFNRLSWLIIDPYTNDRISCLPMHLQVLLNMYRLLDTLN